MRKSNQQLCRREEEEFEIFAKMASTGLRYQDRLEGTSNYVIWKASISRLPDEYDLKAYIDSVVDVHTDANVLKDYKKEMAKAKRLILDGVRDHVVSYIAGKDTARRCGRHLLRYTRDLQRSERCILRRS